MKRNITKFLAALALLVFTMPSLVAWGQTRTETTSTYAWTSKAWEDATSSWTSDKDGYQKSSSPDAVQVTAAYTGAGAHSKSSFTNITKISVNAATTSKGVGNITVKVGEGDAQTICSLSKNSTFGDYELTFDPAVSGVVTFVVNCSTNSMYMHSISVTTADGGSGTSTCATPTFSPAGGTYTSTQNVVISTTTEGATIYYTTDGTDPTTTSSVYSAPISVTETTTVKAMAAADGYNNSAIVTATYTIAAPLTTMDQIFAAATSAGNTATQINVTFGNWVVTGVKNSNAYVTDGTKGFIIYQSSHGFSVGNVLSGTASCKVQLYKGAAEITELTSTTTGLTVTTGGTVTPVTNVSIADLSGVNTGAVFSYENLTYNGSNLVDGNNNAITPYNTFYTYNFETNHVYNVTGVYIQYNTTKELSPRDANDVVEVIASTPTIYLDETSINVGNNNATGDQISATFTVSQSSLTESIALSATLGTLSTSIIAQGAEATEVTWTYTPTEAGNFIATITATSAGAETQTLIITGAAVAPVTGDRYEKVTTNLQDWSGCYIITALYSNKYYALTGVSGNLGGTAEVTVVGNNIESNQITDAYQVIVAQTANGYSLYMDGIGYLYYSGSKNELYASETFTESTSEWEFSISDNLVTLANVNNADRKIQFNYNSGNSRFACYTSSQVKLTLFKYTGTVVLPPVINVTNNTISLEYDETEGSIEYTIDRPVTGTNLTAESEADWISNISVDANSVSFTAGVNNGTADRSATIVLAYEGAQNVEVIVTQAHYVAPFEPATYTLATTIKSGKSYIIVGSHTIDEETNYFAVGEQRNNNRGGVPISVNGTTASVETADVHEVVITALGGDDAGYYTIEDGGYLYAASSSANYLRTKDNLDDHGKWNIEIENGTFSIVAEKSSNRNVMRFNYNNGNPVFACYETATQSPVYLYMKDEASVTETYTLNITGYTDDNTKTGYYLIASPVSVDPANVAGMTTGDFDLYYYDQNGDGEGNEWINYEPNVFNLVPGKGYLYAKKAMAETPSYSFTLTGTPYNNEPIQLVQGWNLVGNPYGQTAYITGEYYVMDADNGVLIAGQTGEIATMQGIFVNAEQTGTMTFSTTNPNGKSNAVVMNLSQNRGNVIDRAIVRFGEGSQLPKFQLNPNNTKIYVTEGNQDFAVVRSAAEGEMPVSFKASENGTYTLAVETENMEMDYLHLIDNMTGMDVDLLQTPSYTFEASTRDHANRFRLVFSGAENGASTGSASFAYYNGTSWNVSNLGEATLQVVDVMGRLVSTEQINGNATLNLNETAGIYMLRLVNGNDVKVQKVVVR